MKRYEADIQRKKGFFVVFSYLHFTSLETSLSFSKELFRDTCYHSVQNLLSSSLLSRNLKVKIYRSIILQVVLCGCETSSLTLREECRLRVFRE